ncbi:hypothetical protein [Amycolatopsis panacis]|uniref:Uncharacterized protein n=1 Tax=Amycolatopsis panacis TaxID=2340917 RepID=A0A419IAN4_9PSEU|nr:hypothetical protein [Amycolatopsis panacis]RJQ91101.1 hypothetical protein D5S19_02390 [Amycolatopsis panacis]
MTTMRGRVALRVLACYETVFAAGALVGGVCLMAGAPGFRLPTAVLAPFGLSTWVLPGVALIVVVGGALGWAAGVAWRGDRQAPGFGYAASVVVAGWLAIQVSVLGFRAPAQWVTLALVGLLVLLSRYVQRVVAR